jgi:hypothetical protein
MLVLAVSGEFYAVVTPEWLRGQASRLFKLADEAKETGSVGIASLLVEAAARYHDQALSLESAQATETATHDAPPMLQQQQIQPDD